ncbi:hypothetical protein U1Q18_022336, partial [Sarracenia purpurea var. burkii]
ISIYFRTGCYSDSSFLPERLVGRDFRAHFFRFLKDRLGLSVGERKCGGGWGIISSICMGQEEGKLGE